WGARVGAHPRGHRGPRPRHHGRRRVPRPRRRGTLARRLGRRMVELCDAAGGARRRRQPPCRRARADAGDGAREQRQRRARGRTRLRAARRSDRPYRLLQQPARRARSGRRGALAALRGTIRRMGDQITCGECGTENPAGASFCMACGKPLSRACPACGTVAPAGAKFCGACGSALDSAEAPAVAAPATELTDTEQRRTVTVLFADISGYTAISERLDHETVKALVERCLTRLAEEVERYGGSVDKYIGDNVMAV